LAAYYLDTSALAKRYAREQGTAWVTALTDPATGNDIFTVRITGPELIAALFRKVRTGELSLIDATRSARNFRRDWAYRYQVIEVDDVMAERAMDLAESHGLRGYDSVHLAAALNLHTRRSAMGLAVLTFVSADNPQLRTADAEGLRTENPDRQP
jgi:predicted nucleic acid-binding protein